MDESSERESIGSIITQRRLARQISQADLAERVGVSQATISRIESSDEYPRDIRLVARIARALDLPLADVLQDSYYGDSDADSFSAFCPNPLCARNSRDLENGEPVVNYSSSKKYPAARFEKVNFCKSCGTELVKDCRGCGSRLTDGISKFCETCGQKIYPDIPDNQWEIIRASLATGPTEDIPF